MDDQSKNIIKEPLEAYFQSSKFVSAYKRIKISTQEEQEQANRSFSIALSPSQRLEYMNFLNRAFLPNYPDIIPTTLKKTIIFNKM